MDRNLEQEVRRRVRDACEYCKMRQEFYVLRFPMDHIIARQHGGVSSLENLALSCPSCNRFKGPNVAGVDPDSGRLTALFHPRHDSWSDHFAWEGARLVGRTAVGRTTIAVLNINHHKHVSVRESLIAEGVFP